MNEMRRPATGPEHADERAATVLTAAATSSPAYTAATAKGAATALVRMFMEQGVFGVDVPPPAEPVPQLPDAAAEAEPAPEPAPEPTAWERAGSAVARAERNRRARGAAVREPEVTSVRLMGDIIGRAARTEPEPPEDRRASALRAA
ncbi:hypothetical protein [Streptomyces sp. Da 82-17]|uniref:hypothetical protein n=1 Tax=Streptomyces sp. Da 82-17 TaxID=3377116 RepID=UPI0038D4B1F1